MRAGTFRRCASFRMASGRRTGSTPSQMSATAGFMRRKKPVVRDG